MAVQSQTKVNLLGLSRPERRQESARTWAQLLEHIHSGNQAGAEMTARQLVDNSRAMAIKMLRSEQSRDS